jgi:hypothetical protein
MTEQELINKQKEYGDSRFAVTRSGKFFCAYGCGAFALARATGYRVMRRPRKGGHCVLTTGFPESRLANVLEQIAACGGEIVVQEANSFVFTGIDGSEDNGLVSEQKPPKGHKATGIQKDEAALREQVLSFDLTRSTPMEAMLFLDTLQRQIKENTV